MITIGSISPPQTWLSNSASMKISLVIMYVHTCVRMYVHTCVYIHVLEYICKHVAEDLLTRWLPAQNFVLCMWGSCNIVLAQMLKWNCNFFVAELLLAGTKLWVFPAGLVFSWFFFWRTARCAGLTLFHTSFIDMFVSSFVHLFKLSSANQGNGNPSFQIKELLIRQGVEDERT